MESLDVLKRIFKRSGCPFEPKAAEKLDAYVSLLRKWNARVNLTASNEWSSIEPLLEEGIWASKIYPAEAASHLDIGSGAGFPAIPIKIMVPGVQLNMVDSRLKRVSFLQTVASELKLSETLAVHGRIGEYLDNNEHKWDCISWKGIKISIADFSKLRNHAHPKTQFWIFHGKELPVEDPAIITKNLNLLRTEKFPSKSEWMLSIYLPI